MQKHTNKQGIEQSVTEREWGDKAKLSVFLFWRLAFA